MLQNDGIALPSHRPISSAVGAHHDGIPHQLSPLVSDECHGFCRVFDALVHHYDHVRANSHAEAVAGVREAVREVCNCCSVCEAIVASSAKKMFLMTVSRTFVLAPGRERLKSLPSDLV